MKTPTLKLAALAAAITGLMALPAGASAQYTWTEEGEPLTATATANVEGSIHFADTYWSGNNAACDASGEIELWNGGPGWAPGKNQFVSLNFSNCSGNVKGCQATGATAQDLPWSGDLVDWTLADFADTKITWTGPCGSVTHTGTLEALLPTDGQGCLDGFDFDYQDVYVGGIELELNGVLEVTSVDGLNYPNNCLMPF